MYSQCAIYPTRSPPIYGWDAIRPFRWDDLSQRYAPDSPPVQTESTKARTALPAAVPRTRFGPTKHGDFST